MPLSAPEHLAKALGRLKPVAASFFRSWCTSCHVDIHSPGLISEVNTVQIDYLKSLYWTKAITSQGNLSDAEAEAAFLVQKRVQIQTSPQILVFFCRVTKASSLFTNIYLYLRDTQKMGRK